MYIDATMYDFPASPPSTEQALAQHLSNWWVRRGQHLPQFAWQYPCWPIQAPSHEEQVRAVVAELGQDAELARIQLCTFLGTPQGKVIAAAVELAIPQPYRLVVQEALMLICNGRGAGRQLWVGVGLVAAVMVLAALFGAAAE